METRNWIINRGRDFWRSVAAKGRGGGLSKLGVHVEIGKNGKVVKAKARLVVSGFNQRPGVD